MKHTEMQKIIIIWQVTKKSGDCVSVCVCLSVCVCVSVYVRVACG